MTATAAHSLYQIETDKRGRTGMRLRLHAGQKRAWDSQARFVFVIAGHQAGKTVFGPHWLLREINSRGPGDYYAVTSTYDLFKLKMLPELMGLFHQTMGWQYQAGDQIMLSPDGSTRIILRSATSPGGLEAGTGKGAWLDECGQDAFGVEAWEAIQRRLAVHKGRVLGTTTPYNMGWLYNLFARWKGGDADYEVVQFRSCDNPAYPMEEYERQRQTLPAWKFEMFCNGVFTKPAGMIYSDYDEAVHLVKPFSIPPDWHRWCGVDFGGTEHTALLWLARDPGMGAFYVYREALGGGMTGPEHAREALRYREPVRTWVGGAKSEDAARAEWHRAGVPVTAPLIADVEAGIDRVIGLFKMRRLYVFETCHRLRGELATYSRELDAAGEPLLRIADKDRYHLCDALRYVASNLPQEGRAEVEPEKLDRGPYEQADWGADFV